MRHRVRAAVNLVNGSTLLGLALASAGGCRLRRGPRALWLADHYRWRFPRAGAFTVGNVVITAGDWPTLQTRSPSLLLHEERHSTQYAWCAGLPMLPLYVLAAGWSFVRTGDLAANNVFERQAGLMAGGYTEVPTRRLWAPRSVLNQ